jgi:hypothetical protein
MRRSVLAALFVALCTVLAAQQAMTNDSVIKMVKAGLSDDIIVGSINSQPGQYDTSADGLIALKTAGASDKVVGAMVAKTGAANAAAAPPPFHSGDGRVRVYVTDHPITEFNSIYRGYAATAHAQMGDDPRTTEIQADMIKICPAFVLVSSDPTHSDLVLVFRRRGGERTSAFAMAGLTGLAISAAAKVNNASIFYTNGDMIFASKQNTVEKAVKDICDHIGPPGQSQPAAAVQQK